MPLTPREVNELHARSDKDSAATAQHHSLGLDPNQASPGHHTHNGRNSKLLMDSVSITGSRTDGTALLNLLSAMETAFGLVDNTSA